MFFLRFYEKNKSRLIKLTIERASARHHTSRCEHVLGSSPGSRPLVAASDAGSTTSRLPIAAT
jgi:hypothetical protein